MTWQRDVPGTNVVLSGWFMEMDETPNEMLLATHAREGYFGLPTPVKNSLHISWELEIPTEAIYGNNNK
jgi:hypothetical protein